jgi:hypothetical protein
MAKKAKKPKKITVKKAVKRRRVLWTKAHDKELRAHSKAKTAVKTISKLMKRTAGALRMRAQSMGIPLGHRR